MHTNGVRTRLTREYTEREWRMVKKPPPAVSGISDSRKRGAEDAVAFAFGEWIQRNVQNELEVLLENVGSLYMSHDEDSADDSVSSNTVELEMTAEADENSAMDVWPEYWLGAPTGEE